MTKARILAQVVSAGNVLADGNINLDELQDVVLIAKTDSDMLMYNATTQTWDNVSAEYIRDKLSLYTKSETDTLILNKSVSMAIALG